MEDVPGTDYISRYGLKYRIVKRVNGKPKHFGVYENLDEAIEARDALIATDWPVEHLHPLSGEKHISINCSGNYVVQKRLNDKLHNFGTYETLVEACDVRDALVDCDWRLDFLDRGMRFIKDCHNGSYQVRHWENGKDVHYGTFHSLEEAKRYRDNCVNNDWHVSKKRMIRKRNLPKYVTLTMSGNYLIRRMIGDKTEYFGTFHSKRDAVDERDMLNASIWNYDHMESLDETVGDGNIIWLNKRMRV